MNASDPGERSTRVEREVLEILERVSDSESPVENVQAAVRRQGAITRAQLAKTSNQRWLLREWPQDLLRLAASLVLAIAAALIAEVFRLGAIMLAIASAVAFFSLWVPARVMGPGNSPRWRGQDLRDRDDPPGFDSGRIRPSRGPKGPGQ